MSAFLLLFLLAQLPPNDDTEILLQNREAIEKYIDENGEWIGPTCCGRPWPGGLPNTTCAAMCNYELWLEDE